MNKEKIQNTFKFFYLFARFECALKVIGFHQGNNREAKPNWDKYAKSIEDKFNKDNPKIKKSVDYFKDYPPKKQMVRDGALCWETSTDDPNELKNLFLGIRRVRNNLFHGGKFKGIWFEYPERSETLIEHATLILEYCCQISPEIGHEIDLEIITCQFS